MTETLIPPPADAIDHGRVGDRDLVCVQTIGIGRLRSAPVPVTPDTFIAVSGRGPKGDSNGSGKTTFLGAISLLLGDVGWRPAAGAPEAATLLFDGLKAGVDVERYARAERGYVIGVFARPSGAAPLTVWMRINANAPYLKIRCIDGVHLVDIDGASHRGHAADEAWQLLPKPEWGSRSYASELYGPTPRCMAWLQARGNETPGKSLLKLAQEPMEPHQIGTALLELLGRDDLLTGDLEARADLDATVRELEQLRIDDEDRRRAEDTELAAIHGRAQARDQLDIAQAQWQLHWAKGYLDAVARDRAGRRPIRDLGLSRRAAKAALRASQQELDALSDETALQNAAKEAATDESTAKQASDNTRDALRDLRADVNALDAERERLRPLVARADARTSAETAAALHGTQLAVEDARERLGACKAATATAVANLDAAQTGGGGAVGATIGRLTSASITGASLLDHTEVDPTHRHVWEPRLALYADAVVVAETDLPAALAVAAPGDAFVTGPSHAPDPFDLPEGITSSPVEALPFLAALATTGTGAVDEARFANHVVVAGGFPEPTSGRAARVHAAEVILDRAQREEAEAQQELDVALAGLETATEEHDAAIGRDAFTDAGTRLERLRGQLHGAAERADTAAIAYDKARERTGDAREAYGAYRATKARLENEVAQHEAAVQHAAGQQRQAIETARRVRALIDYWRTRWTGTLDDADAAIAADVASSGDARSSSGDYRRAANRALNLALRRCGIDEENGEGAAPGSGIDLAVTERTRAGETPADDGGIIQERQVRAFASLVDALGSWLERLASEDGIAAQHIAADRERRDEARAATEKLCAARQRDLPVIQDQIERLLRTTLNLVSERLDTLDRNARGAGADLKIEPQRPQMPTDTWRWSVVPRYRRGPGGPLVPYTERANTAAEKLLAIHLVLAALFASTAGRSVAGRVLILDELGDSLGDYHREAVLRALATTAAQSHITVLGTCQDGVLEDAAEHAGLLLYFQFRDPSDVLNAPTRVFGTAPEGLVELTAPHIERLA